MKVKAMSIRSRHDERTGDTRCRPHERASASTVELRRRMMQCAEYKSEYYAWMLQGSPRFSLTGTRVSVCGGRPKAGGVGTSTSTSD